MDIYKEKAIKLVQEAEKKLATAGFLGFLFGSANKNDEAAECYQRAGNLYKISKNWEDAADCFAKTANLMIKIGSRHDAASAYVDAANSYKKFDKPQAENYYLKAIEIYLDMGRFTVAAKHHQTIAEMYEEEPLDHDKIIQHLEQASDYFRGEESTSCANRCLLKVAMYAAEMENYEKAIVIYEQIAISVSENSLLKYCAREYFFRAILCHLCVDTASCQVTLENYCQKYPAFTDTREYKLVRKMLENFEEQNLEELTEAIREFDSINRLDKWFTMMLLRIKNKLNGKIDLR